jgi:hypothetical protein
LISELRSTAQRKSDVVAALERKGSHAWLATASRSGNPHLIAAAFWWDGKEVVIATREETPTGRNLKETGQVRLAIGSPEDVIMIDLEVIGDVQVSKADDRLHKGFIQVAGWDPAEEGPDWSFFRLRPNRVEAYRGYGELKGRAVMRDSRWLA